MHEMNLSNAERLILLKLVNIKTRAVANDSKASIVVLTRMYELQNKLKLQGDIPCKERI